MAYKISYSDYTAPPTATPLPPTGESVPGGPSFIGNPQPPDVPCDPTGDGWRGPIGPQGVPGPPGPVGPDTGLVGNVMDYGAIMDGNSHPLSSRYATLAAAQAVYPHATSLTDEIDWCAIQAAVNALLTCIVIPGGTAIINKAIVSSTAPVTVQGAGQGSTVIVADGRGAGRLAACIKPVVSYVRLGSTLHRRVRRCAQSQFRKFGNLVHGARRQHHRLSQHGRKLLARRHYRDRLQPHIHRARADRWQRQHNELAIKRR